MPVPITLAGGTKTLSSNFSTSELITVSSGTTINRTTTETFSCGGGLAVNSTLAGTATISLTGGTWSGTNTTGISAPLNINGAITISGNVYYGTGTISYTSGTITGGTLNIVSNCTLNTSTLVWNNIAFIANSTTTLTSNLIIGGLWSTGTAQVSPIINSTTSETVTCAGGIFFGNNCIPTGTAKHIITGGSLDTNAGYGGFGLPLDIAGDITILFFAVQSKPVNYISGVVTTTGSTFYVGGGSTLNLSGISFNNFTKGGPTTAGGATTMTSNIVVNGLLRGAGTFNRTGSETITCNGGISADNNSFQGNVELVAKGGTITTLAYTYSIDCNLTVDGNVTFAGNALYHSGEYGAGSTLKYVSGTTNASSTTLYIRRASSIDTSGISWGALVRSMSGGAITTLISNLNVIGATSIISSGPINTSTSAKLITGGLTLSAAQSGTATIELSGGAWRGNFAVSHPFIFNGSSAISGSVQYGGSLITYTSGSVTSSAANLTFTNSTQTLALSGSNINVPMTFAGGTKTLSTNFDNNALVTISGATTVNRVVSQSFNCSGGIAVNSTLAGTSVVTLKGGTWSGTNTTGISAPLNIDGNVTISGNVYYGTGTLGYLSGTVTGGTLNLVANCTINTSTLAWNNLTISSGTTYTLTSDLNINGLLSAAVGGGTAINRTTNQVINCFGGFNIGNNFTGNATIVAKGGTLISNGFAAINGPALTIDGDVTISGAFTYGGGTMTYLSGSVNTQGTTLGAGSSTLNTKGIEWNNVTIADTVTLSSDMVVNGLFTNLNGSFVNKTNNEILYLRGGLNVANFWMRGNGTISLQGGTWTQTAIRNVECNMIIDGNVTFGSNCAFQIGTLTYKSGNIKGLPLNIVGSCNIIDFHKCKSSIPNVIITTGATVTMNEFFTGTPTNPAVISASTALGQYTVTFTDSFEKIGKNVVVSGCVPSRPLQLVLPYTTRTSAIKTTNRGIRYTNQSPNSISRDSKINPEISPIGLLVSDPNFKVP
jgi:hypothetical protein